MVYRRSDLLFLIHYLHEDHSLIYVYSLPTKSEIELIEKGVNYNTENRRKLILYS
jgi:hypothetical protein